MERPKLILAACLVAGSCASPTPPADIYGSISKCGLEGKLRVEQQGEGEFKVVYLNPDTDYEKVDCFLDHANRLGLNLGFVGNEAPAPE
jgi:hypothetical protein